VLLRSRSERSRVGSVCFDDPQFRPVEGFGGFPSAVSEEVDGGGAVSVVEPNHGAKVVPVGRAEGCAEGQVSGHFFNAGEPLYKVEDVVAEVTGSALLRGDCDVHPLFEVDGGSVPCEVIDALKVGVETVRELLCVERVTRSTRSSSTLPARSSRE